MNGLYVLKSLDTHCESALTCAETKVITWICTSDALRANLCSQSDLGKFIVDLPSNMSISDTSIWSASVQIGNSTTSPSGDTSSGFWNPPGGTPALPSDSSDDGPTNWRRAGESATYPYTGQAIHYKVPKTGYYCVGEAFRDNSLTSSLMFHVTRNGSRHIHGERHDNTVAWVFRRLCLIPKRFQGRATCCGLPKDQGLPPSLPISLYYLLI